MRLCSLALEHSRHFNGERVRPPARTGLDESCGVMPRQLDAQNSPASLGVARQLMETGEDALEITPADDEKVADNE